jgi:hypothetical protein
MWLLARSSGVQGFSAERNPYKGMTVDDAKADIPRLEDAIAKSRSLGLGGQPELAGHEQDYGIELSQEQSYIATVLIKTRDN